MMKKSKIESVQSFSKLYTVGQKVIPKLSKNPKTKIGFFWKEINETYSIPVIRPTANFEFWVAGLFKCNLWISLIWKWLRKYGTL